VRARRHVAVDAGVRLQRLVALLVLPAFLLVTFGTSGCGSTAGSVADNGRLDVVAAESFLADIAQNVSGDRFKVRCLVPVGTDPHSFDPTPSDVGTVAAADLLIVNGGGLEGPLLDVLKNAGGDTTVVDASAGLATRVPKPGEPPLERGQTDPHFWLDPTLVETYVANISAAFIAADPAGKATYAANALTYVQKLRTLDEWVRKQVATVPPAERKLIMNHASHGYFADRYGFRVVGTLIPSVGTGDTPTARQLGAVTAAIRSSGAKAIFVESGENPQLARQIAAETGITVVDDLLDHSLTPVGGHGATYIDMLRYDAQRIVEALE
jgi:ABC-type Zn uptake system ZnuABC Zn-binding protein ZnuA